MIHRNENVSYRRLNLYRKKNYFVFPHYCRKILSPITETMFLILHHLMSGLHNLKCSSYNFYLCMCLCVTVFKTQWMLYLASTRAGTGFCLSGCCWILLFLIQIRSKFSQQNISTHTLCVQIQLFILFQKLHSFLFSDFES